MLLLKEINIASNTLVLIPILLLMTFGFPSNLSLFCVKVGFYGCSISFIRFVNVCNNLSVLAHTMAVAFFFRTCLMMLELKCNNATPRIHHIFIRDYLVVNTNVSIFSPITCIYFNWRRTWALLRSFIIPFIILFFINHIFLMFPFLVLIFV